MARSLAAVVGRPAATSPNGQALAVGLLQSSGEGAQARGIAGLELVDEMDHLTVDIGSSLAEPSELAGDRDRAPLASGKVDIGTNDAGVEADRAGGGDVAFPAAEYSS